MNFYIISGLLIFAWRTSSQKTLPDEQDLVLSMYSDYTLSCSAESPVSWKHDSNVISSSLEDSNGLYTNTLSLHNVTGLSTGRYTCLYNLSSSQMEVKSVYIFVPDPSMWFLPIAENDEFLLVPMSSKFTIPCRVTNPNATVTLHEKAGDAEIQHLYDPKEGFTGYLEDKNYYCKASLDGVEVQSNPFFVYTIQVDPDITMDIMPIQSTVRIGENITIMCTVARNDIVNFNWSYPGMTEGRPIHLDHQPIHSKATSILFLTNATLEDSGIYVCSAEEGFHGLTGFESTNITVIEKGYIAIEMQDNEQTADLHQSKSIEVAIESYPKPTIEWLRGGQLLSPQNNSLLNIATEDMGKNNYITTLSLIRVKEQDGGQYTLKVYHDDASKEIPFNIQINVPVEIKELIDSHPGNGGQMVTCVGRGNPMPTITWYICTELERCSGKGWEQWEPLHNTTSQMKFDLNITYQQPEGGVHYVKSMLHIIDVKDSLSVRCLGDNDIGRERYRDVTLVPHYLRFKVVLLSAILGLVALVVIFLIILIILWQKKPRYEIRWKVIESVSPDGHEYIYVDPLQLPYDSSWEISRDKLALGRTLGSGAFGRVVEATAYGLGHAQSSIRVAVKMLKSTARSSEKQALMSELKIMSHLGPHLNIVNLLAACTKGGPIYIVTEYCRFGDLVDYLHRNKHTFLQYYADKSRKESEVYSNASTGERMSSHISVSVESDGGYMDMSKDDIYYVPMLDLKEDIKYAEIEVSNYGTTYELENYSNAAPDSYTTLINESPVLSYTDLIGFSYQVANGMEFLASKNCVHRDLAARNVLICEGKLVKICDFGLARDIVRDDNYISKGNTFLPLKWMAPESIFNNLYTTLSDVWSFGILLWEIFTLGGTPYPELPMNEQFYNAIKRGYRMSRPTYASEEIYEIMQKCWNEKFEKRPSFSVLTNMTGNLLVDGYKQRYKQVNEEFLRSEHPAVVRVRPRKLNNGAEGITNILYSAVQPNDSEYIIPLPDPKPEDSEHLLNENTESRPSSTLQEGNTSSTISCDSPLEQPEQEAENNHPEAEHLDVEESFL